MYSLKFDIDGICIIVTPSNTSIYKFVLITLRLYRSVSDCWSNQPHKLWIMLIYKIIEYGNRFQRLYSFIYAYFNTGQYNCTSYSYQVNFKTKDVLTNHRLLLLLPKPITMYKTTMIALLLKYIIMLCNVWVCL